MFQEERLINDPKDDDGVVDDDVVVVLDSSSVAGEAGDSLSFFPARRTRKKNTIATAVDTEKNTGSLFPLQQSLEVLSRVRVTAAVK